MDCRAEPFRKTNPRENANWLSILTFFFAVKIFKQFPLKDVQDTDIYKVVKSFVSENLGNKLEVVWSFEKRNGKNRFLYALFKIFWRQWVLWIFLVTVVDTVIMIIYPLLLGKLVSYFTPDTKMTLQNAMVYTAGLFGLILFYTFYAQAYVLYIVEVGLKVRIACSSLMYRKCLKLGAFISEKNVNGLVITVISKDINQLEYAIDVIILMISGTFQAAIMVYMMYVEIGVAALLGASVLIILLPLQAVETLNQFTILQFCVLKYLY